MKLSPRRAEVLSLLAFFLQIGLFFLTFLIGHFTGSVAAKVEAWHFLGGSIVWLLLILQFHQQRLAQEEKLDAEQYQRLQRQGKDTSVFEGMAVEDQMHLAVRRLRWLEKYLIPVFGALLAIYLLGISYVAYRTVKAPGSGLVGNSNLVLQSAAFLVGFALISFLFSRYAVGMSQQRVWRPIRAGGSYLLSNALACFALAIILVFANAGYLLAERVMAYVLIAILIAIGAETVLNLILDAYRPRIKGFYRRAPFESRLLGLFSEPGGILRTAAHAIDYQFGFKVSETWFYKLLERAVVPLLIFWLFTLYLLSGLSVVPPGNVGVLERWGKPLNILDTDDGSPRFLESGLHLKFPWPIDYIRTFPVEQVQAIDIGFERMPENERPKTTEQRDRSPILWTVEHWKNEYPFMVAVAQDRPDQTLQAGLTVTTSDRSGYNIFDMLVVPLTVHYRIADVVKYGYGPRQAYADPQDLLRCICANEALQYCAQNDIESLMGPGRDQTTQTLKKAIQAQVDHYQLGVEIVFAGLETIHPPVEVAKAFEDVVAALQQKQVLVLSAKGQADRIVNAALGQSATIQAEAQSYRYERAKLAHADAQRFAQQQQAFQKGKDVYLWREFLTVLDDTLPAMRKYVMAAPDVSKWIYQVDLKEKLQPDLLEGLELETPQESSK